MELWSSHSGPQAVHVCSVCLLFMQIGKGDHKQTVVQKKIDFKNTKIQEGKEFKTF